MKRVEKEIDRTIRDARDKEKRQRRKPKTEDDTWDFDPSDYTPVEPIIMKSHLRRLERKT